MAMIYLPLIQIGWTDLSIFGEGGEEVRTPMFRRFQQPCKMSLNFFLWYHGYCSDVGDFFLFMISNKDENMGDDPRLYYRSTV